MHTYLISCDILFYSMMQRQADKAGRKVAFLDPLAIAEKRHYGPMLWNDDHDDFKNCQSRKEINEVRKKEHRNHYDSWYVHIASVSTVVGRGCHMGTI